MFEDKREEIKETVSRGEGRMRSGGEGKGRCVCFNLHICKHYTHMYSMCSVYSASVRTCFT